MTPPVKKPGQSQLDFLWFKFKDYWVTPEASEQPQDTALLTETALIKLLNSYSNKGITKLEYRNHPTDENSALIVGLAANGSEITQISIPKEIHVQEFTHRQITQGDIDKGISYPINTNVLSIILTNGAELLVNLDELGFVTEGGETQTVRTEIIDNSIHSHVKIDPDNNSVIEINTSDAGLYSDIKISEDSEIALEKTNSGLVGKIPLQGSNNSLKFRLLTLDEYKVLPVVDPNTVYFIAQKSYFYLGENKYGLEIPVGSEPIIKVDYNKQSMKLSYWTAGSDRATEISLGPANETTPGMMSTTSYQDLQNVKTALEGVSDVKDYISQQLKNLNFVIATGEEKNSKIPLQLLNSEGVVISQTELDAEDYLATGLVKKAEQGETSSTVSLGDPILILTLKSGKKIITNLSELTDTYTGKKTNTIDVQVNNYEISADLNINSTDKMLYVDEQGIASYFQVDLKQNKLVFYGKTKTDVDKLGEYILPNTLISYKFIATAIQATISQYPPTLVNGEEYNEVDNPVVIGNPYLILTFGPAGAEGADSYYYNDYLALSPLLNSIAISPNPNNLLTRDESGLLARIQWKDV